MGDNWTDACMSVAENYFAGTPDELESLVTKPHRYGHVPVDKFSTAYAGALGLETAVAGGLVFASLACPLLWTVAFPLALDVIARCDDIKHGRKYGITDGEEARQVSLPVGLLGTLKDWYNKRSG